MALLRLTFLLSSAFCLVWMLRSPARKLGGSRFTYSIWLLVPLVLVAGFLPPPPAWLATLFHPLTSTSHDLSQNLNLPVFYSSTPDMAAEPHSVSAKGAKDLAEVCLLGIWAVGSAFAFVRVSWLQNKFVRALGKLTPDAEAKGVYYSESGALGPAAFGVWRSRIVLPPDFPDRFEPDEQVLVLAHERTHLREGHTITGALAVTIVCIQWFNPLAHLAVKLFRIDQELACDATVVSIYPKAKAAYARAMLKARGKTLAPPLAYCWLDPFALPMKTRIDMLRAPKPQPMVKAICLGLLTTVSSGAGLLAFATVPTRPVVSLNEITTPQAQPTYSPSRDQATLAQDRSKFQQQLTANSSGEKLSDEGGKSGLKAARAKIIAAYDRQGGVSRIQVNGQSYVSINANQLRANMGDEAGNKLAALDKAIDPPAAIDETPDGPQQFTVPPGLSEDDAAQAVGLPSAAGYGRIPAGPRDPWVMVKCNTPTTPANARCAS